MTKETTALLLLCLFLLKARVQSLSVRPFTYIPRTCSLLATGNTRLSASLKKTDEEWRSILTPEEYYVLREKGTERPNSSVLNNLNTNNDSLTVVCKGCGAPLFTPSTKYESGTGWPSFFAPISSQAIEYEVDFQAILPRTECVCANCGGHLGHVFDDGPPPTGMRYCMNGIALNLATQSDETDVVTAETTAVASMAVSPEQQAPERAIQMPAKVMLPSVLINAGIAALFLSSWIQRVHPDETDLTKQILNGAFPIPVALFYGYKAVKALLKIKK